MSEELKIKFDRSTELFKTVNGKHLITSDFYYKGKPIETLTVDELCLAVRDLYKSLQEKIPKSKPFVELDHDVKLGGGK